MKLKLDANGNPVMQDGKFVYVMDDGKEIALDPVAMHAKIGQLNGEAKAHREAKEAAENTLKTFAGITDPAAALKALETVKNFDAKKLVDAGEVETIKREATKAAEDKIAELNKAHAQELQKRDKDYSELQGSFHGSLLSTAFASSKFVTDKLAIPSDIAQSQFGRMFKVEDGKIVGYADEKGSKIYSRAKPGELADFDEALETLVDAYPNKDHILKGTGQSGSGARQGGKEEAGKGSGKGIGNMGGTKTDRTAAIAARFKLPVS